MKKIIYIGLFFMSFLCVGVLNAKANVDYDLDCKYINDDYGITVNIKIVAGKLIDVKVATPLEPNVKILNYDEYTSGYTTHHSFGKMSISYGVCPQDINSSIWLSVPGGSLKEVYVLESPPYGPSVPAILVQSTDSSPEKNNPTYENKCYYQGLDSEGRSYDLVTTLFGTLYGYTKGTTPFGTFVEDYYEDVTNPYETSKGTRPNSVVGVGECGAARDTKCCPAQIKFTPVKTNSNKGYINFAYLSPGLSSSDTITVELPLTKEEGIISNELQSSEDGYTSVCNYYNKQLDLAQNLYLRDSKVIAVTGSIQYGNYTGYDNPLIPQNINELKNKTYDSCPSNIYTSCIKSTLACTNDPKPPYVEQHKDPEGYKAWSTWWPCEWNFKYTCTVDFDKSSSGASSGELIKPNITEEEKALIAREKTNEEYIEKKPSVYWGKVGDQSKKMTGNGCEDALFLQAVEGGGRTLIESECLVSFINEYSNEDQNFVVNKNSLTSSTFRSDSIEAYICQDNEKDNIRSISLNTDNRIVLKQTGVGSSCSCNNTLKCELTESGRIFSDVEVITFNADNSYYVPLRFISEALGYYVEWEYTTDGGNIYINDANA